MVRAFQALVAKEVKDLLKDRKIVVGMIVVPLLLFPLMGEVISLSSQSASSAASSTTLAIMNLDQGNYSSLATTYFSSLPGVTVAPIPPQQVADAMQAAIGKNSSTLVVIPPDFSAELS